MKNTLPDTSEYVKSRPILFSAPMVRAILAGTKTQTRRPVKPQPKVVHGIYGDASIDTNCIFPRGDQRIHCPFGAPGDRLWVRETWAAVRDINGTGPLVRPHLVPDPMVSCADQIIWRADGDIEWLDDDGFISDRSCWSPSIHMPRWACRLVLEIVSVRVERLQEISEANSRAEGCEQAMIGYRDYTPYSGGHEFSRARNSFRSLWDATYNRKGSRWATWGSNPWVWVVEFTKVVRP